MDGRRVGSKEGRRGGETRIGGGSERRRSREVVRDGKDWRSRVDGECPSDGERVLMSPLVPSSSTDLLDFGDSERYWNLSIPNEERDKSVWRSERGHVEEQREKGMKRP